MYINYEEINETLTPDRIKEILDKLEIPYKDNGDFLVMPTVCHNSYIDEASWKLYFYFNNHLFVCYTEDGNMSIWTFLKRYYETRQVEYEWYKDIYQVIVGDSQPGGLTKEKYKSLSDKFEKRNKNVLLSIYSENVLGCFVKKYPIEWLNDGISKEAMDKYNILYSISQNKIIIPHYNIDNELVGIRGRALNKEEVERFGKYMPVLIEGIWYKHPLSLNLYGLNLNKDNIKKTGVCYLFEAEKSVLQCESFNMPNCAVAVCGSQFNIYQLMILLRYTEPKEIIICFDREEKDGEDKYLNKLWAICEKYKNYCNFSFIYDRDKITHMKDSPSDRGEEVFRNLLNKRRKIR